MEKKDDPHDLFVTEFPKGGRGLVDYLQGRVHFALLDQMRLMASSGMAKAEIRDEVLGSVARIVDEFDPKRA